MTGEEDEEDKVVENKEQDGGKQRSWTRRVGRRLKRRRKTRKKRKTR